MRKIKVSMKIKVLSALILISLMLTGCGNKNIMLGNYTYTKAKIDFGGKVKTYKISSWKDFDDGDQIEVTLEDGTNMLIHSNNIILLSK